MHILIVRNNSNVGAMAASRELMDHLVGRGVGCSVCDAFDLPRQHANPTDGEDDSAGLRYSDAAGSHLVDLVVVLGGDGTTLRAARMVGTSGVPIIGINFGHLGFLSNPGSGGVTQVVDAALAGDVVREDRSNLHIEASCVTLDEGGAVLEKRHSASYFALNELAITRGNLGRVVGLSIAVNGDRFMTIRGDGVVLASATGSTAYALSAGGPVLSPAHRGMVMVPLAPHSLRSRAAVTAADEVVTIDLADDEATRSSSFFIDGALLRLGGVVNRFTVRTGERPTTLLRHRYDGFYSNAAKTFL